MFSFQIPLLGFFTIWVTCWLQSSVNTNREVWASPVSALLQAWPVLLCCIIASLFSPTFKSCFIFKLGISMFQVVDVQTMLLQQYGTLVKSLYYILESTLSATIMELIVLARITGPDPRILLINALFQVKVSNLSFISFQVTAWAGWICRVTTRPKINLQSQTGHPALNSQVHHLLLVSCLFCCLFVLILLTIV